ncbi:MAG: type IV pilin protein [Ectothiorhodospiraceae bacterium]|nr:type IV pilin protein [Ectothiorhodospiraceae bacterium]
MTHQPNACRGREQGFSLIELMIVVLIMGIIAAIAYPRYQQHVQNTRMATAQADLMELAQRLERHYSINNTYQVGGNDPDLSDAPWFDVSPRDGNVVAYNLGINNVTASSYTLTATPTGPQAGHRCGVLSLTHNGQRSAAEADCW